MQHWCPVSPFLHATSCVKGAPEEKDIEIDDAVRKEDVVFDEPVVGHRPTSITDPAPRPLVTPNDMSEGEFAEHCLTHLPYCQSRHYCVAGKRNNVLHVKPPGVARSPFVAAAYGFLTMRDTDEVIHFICVCVKPWRIYFASVIGIKGPNPQVVKRLARWFGELRLSQFAYHSDREPTIRALLRAATITAGVTAIDESKPETHDSHAHGPIAGVAVRYNAPDNLADQLFQQLQEEDAIPVVPLHTVPVAVPEESMPGESRSNGQAERAIQTIEDQLRTMKAALEDRIEASIPCSRAAISWMVEYAAVPVTQHVPGEDVLSGYGRLHGQNPKERLPVFGETALFYLPATS